MATPRPYFLPAADPDPKARARQRAIDHYYWGYYAGTEADRLSLVPRAPLRLRLGAHFRLAPIHDGAGLVEPLEAISWLTAAPTPDIVALDNDIARRLVEAAGEVGAGQPVPLDDEHAKIPLDVNQRLRAYAESVIANTADYDDPEAPDGALDPEELVNALHGVLGNAWRLAATLYTPIPLAPAAGAP